MHAKSDELIAIELDLRIGRIAFAPRALAPAQRPEGGRVPVLLAEFGSATHNIQMLWPGQSFTFSFEHHGRSFSFHSRLFGLIPPARSKKALFSMPSCIYERLFRKSYRVPVTERDGVFVLLNGNRVEPLNLTMEGIGVATDGPLALRIGQRIAEVEVIIGGRSCRSSGHVRHVTTRPDGTWLYGISVSYATTDLPHIQQFIADKQLGMAGLPL